MQENYFEEKSFGKEFVPQKGEYENCDFNYCNFADCDLSDYRFVNCRFKDCNFSLAKLYNTMFQDVKFLDCKMVGLQFDMCNEFGISFSFEGCGLNHSCFYRMNLKRIVFKNSQLQEVDFVEADLSNAVFQNCDLSGAVFDRTLLEKADFRTSYNYTLDPEVNRIKKAKFSSKEVLGLLEKYDIEIEY